MQSLLSVLLLLGCVGVVVCLWLLWRRRVYEKRFAGAEVLRVPLSEEFSFRWLLNSAQWSEVYPVFDQYCDEGFASLSEAAKLSLRSRLSLCVFLARNDSTQEFQRNALNFSFDKLEQLMRYWVGNMERRAEITAGRFLGKWFRIEFENNLFFDEPAEPER